MGRYKFAINKDGFYSHYGTDGTIEFDDTFNKDNPPFNHKYVGGNWVADIDKLVIGVSNKIKAKLDDLGQVLIYNETYFGTEGYDLFRNKVLSDIADYREMLGNMVLITDNIPLEEIKEMKIEELSENYRKLKNS